MRRRELITLVGGTVIVWPLSARAQSTDRVRVIGMLNILGPDDPETKARNTVFGQTLQQLGWKIGRDLDSLRRDAAELVALAPDVLFSSGSLSVAPLQQATRTIPISNQTSTLKWAGALPMSALGHKRTSEHV